MKLEHMRPGMVVYDVGRKKMGNTTMTTVSYWGVLVVSVDAEKRTVVARWNGYNERTYSERHWKKWRAKPPVLVRDSMGRARLATREEKAAMKSNGAVSGVPAAGDEHGK